MVQASAGVGASIPRTEDDRFLRGRGQYVGDLRMPGRSGASPPGDTTYGE